MSEKPLERVLSLDPASEVLPGDDVSSVLATAHKVLWADEVTEIGLWEAGPGSDIDVEVDEVFLILSGAGTVVFHDGSRIELKPGTLIRLRAGDRTTWEITERLRKLYVASHTSDSNPPEEGTS